MTVQAHSRRIQRIVKGVETSDGAGVRLTRIIGTQALPQIDPFLLLDHFHSDRPDDYIAGFPPHPHRGFETVTYLFAGRMEHQDNAGHGGVVEAGGVQWMTAGRGIVHSEMPRQEKGLLSGFQLWVNLPASMKMTAPRYQEFTPDQVPLERHEDGTEIRVVAGRTGQGTTGPVKDLATPALYLDIRLPAGVLKRQPVPDDWQGLVYVLEGSVEIAQRSLDAGQLGVLEPRGDLLLKGVKDARLLLIAGQALREPVARSGPFVMNSEQELRQAYRDFGMGVF
ncbi:MAG: pirin family protein [Chromatiales bacterium]|nr:pirin family protein [Chromatiales bacterium]